MQIATLGLIYDNRDRILLGEKLRGEIGTGVVTGPGGKQEPGETLRECLIRETSEELGVELDSTTLILIAVIDFYAAGVLDFRVHVFKGMILSGRLRGTDDFRCPQWYEQDGLPLNRMFDGDQYWFPKLVAGETFNANVYYHERAKNFDRIEFLPFAGE